MAHPGTSTAQPRDTQGRFDTWGLAEGPDQDLTADLNSDGFDPWADPFGQAEPQPDLPPDPAPEPSTQPDLPPLGAESGLYADYWAHRDRDGRDDAYQNPIVVTVHNRDLLAGLTQADINDRTEAFVEARRIERERVLARVTAADLTLPTDPTPEDIRRVAAAVDDAFSDSRFTLSVANQQGPLPVLSEVYGTPDRALVALGEAVANRADVLATGEAAGGAKAVEERWINRCMAAEEADRAAYAHAVAEGRRPRLNGVDYVKSPEMQALESARDEQTRAALEDVTDSYLAALAEVRPMGGTLDLHEQSSKPGAAIAAQTAQVWPADWLEVSNSASNRLHIGTSNRRGHYAHDTHVEFTKRGQGQRILLGRTRSFRHTADGRFEATPDQINLEPDYHWNESLKQKGPGRVYTFWRPMTDEEKAEQGWADRPDAQHAVVGTDWVVESPDYFDRMEEFYRARGREAEAAKIRNGWELASDPNFNDGEPFYRKPKIRQNKTGAERVSQIKLSGSGGSGLKERDPRYPVAVHEIGHRMEYLVPNLNRMTRTWRDRRVSESPTESGKTLRTIYRGTSEKGYSDEFVDHYIGKSYDGRRSGGGMARPAPTADNFVEATEVFSMGADSVFGGRNGGLIGLSRDKGPDPDMRAFILGCFAAAGMSKHRA